MRELPAPPVLVNWFTAFAGRQHGFVGKVFSLCERVRFSARLEVDRQAPFCPECVALVRLAANRILDYIVDSEAESGYAEQDLRNRMTSPDSAMPEPLLIAGYGGLPDDDR